ncbi:MAG TPA: outer membrane lipoprotein-sorting protein [Vicinamibacterales bacterium]|nr:outer membrane lipoprotein-sorting protein [Vicinamibacterales bacterium]
MRRFLEWVLRYRVAVIAATAAATVALGSQVTKLQVIIDPNSFLPKQHPFVRATDEVERRFGSEYVVVIGVTANSGDIYQPSVLQKVQRITAKIQDLPNVVSGNVLSLTARKAKDIVGDADGMVVRPLVDGAPEDPATLDALRAAMARNPAYVGTVVSEDGRTTAILAEFRDPGPGGFRSIVDRLTPIVDAERDASVRIAIGGLPPYLNAMEVYSERIAWLFPLAVLLTGLIHYEAFRTLQGLILPLVTAFLAVLWSLGFMGFARVPMDVFNITTPILILAVAAGHAVQILKRYYEEYNRLRTDDTLSPREANHGAVIASLSRTGPVMLVAGIVAALGFLSLLVFELSAVRTFGVFAGVGILSALVIELTLVPAVRSLLPPPAARERARERERRGWDRAVERVAAAIATRRSVVFATALVIAGISAAGAAQVQVDESMKGLFWDDMPIVQDDSHLNEQLAGTNTLYLLVRGNRPDAMKDPAVLQAMERTQAFLEQDANVGKTLSLTDFVKRMNRSMNGDDPAADRVPTDGALVSQYLLLYSMSGDPGDFDTYVDYDYQHANMWVFLKTDSSAYFTELASRLVPFIEREFPKDVSVEIGGSVAMAAAVRETIIRSKTLNMVQIGAVVLIVTAIVFRSIVGGLMVLVPLAGAVLANFGVMGWFGIPLNVPNALTSAMAFGIGADYAIYLLFRMREEYAQGASEEESAKLALLTAGKAVLFVAAAVGGGYATLLLSWGFNFHIWMAILISSAMVISSIATLTLIPALALVLRPRFIFGEQWRVALRARTAASTAAALLVLAATASAQSVPARDIMSRNFTVQRVPDSTSDAEIVLTNRVGQERRRKIVSTTKLKTNGIDNRRMTRFLSPPDVRDTAVLTVENSEGDDDIWIYLPALKKVRRLVASNKKDSFAGTDFTYGDVIGYRIDDWEHTVTGEETIDGAANYVVDSTPKTPAVRDATGYSKRRSWIRKDNFVQTKGEFWDRAGQLLKAVRFTDIRLVDSARQRWQPMKLEAINAQTGHRTVITLENFKANQGVKDEFFSARYLEEGR